ncbi:unnamed protein product, partial [Allacma fusca]
RKSQFLSSIFWNRSSNKYSNLSASYIILTEGGSIYSNVIYVGRVKVIHYTYFLLTHSVECYFDVKERKHEKMALWNKVQQLNEASIQKVHSLYGEHFPIEVRYILAGWIEDKILGVSVDIDPDNPAHEHYISNVVIELINVLEAKAQNMVNDDPCLNRIRLINAAQTFRQRYTTDPLALYRFLRHCLTVESHLVEQMTVGNALGLNAIADESAEIMERLAQIKQKTMETADILRRMEQEQEAFAIKCHDRQKLEGIMQLHRMRAQPITVQTQQLEKDFNAQKERIDYELKQKITGLMQLKNELEEKIHTTVSDLSHLQGKVLDDELTRWKRDQQLAGNGAFLNNNLDTLQSWCEDLAELIWHNRHQLKEAERLKQNIPVFSQPQPTMDRLASLQEKVKFLYDMLNVYYAFTNFPFVVVKDSL